jgi:hypothetical protein
VFRRRLRGIPGWREHSGPVFAASQKASELQIFSGLTRVLPVHRTPAGSIVRDFTKPTPLLCLDIVHEFLVQPRLRLTPTQVRRLWSLSPDRCAAVLQSLVSDGYLEVEPDGRYVLSINKMYRTV